VFIPRTIYLVGFPTGILINIFCVSTTYLSSKLYFESMQLSAFPCKTIYDLAYIVFRARWAMILVGLFLLGCTAGCILTYFVLFGEISAAFAKEFASQENQDAFYCERYFYIIILCSVMSPLFYSKQIKELIIVAIMLCVVFALMIATFGYKASISSLDNNSDF
jgi:amino acid permease